MRSFQQQILGIALVAGLLSISSTASAQNAVRTAVQQGQSGAFVHKTDQVYNIPNASLGIPGLAPDAQIEMTQTKFIITPSGKSTSVLVGKLPSGVAPPTQQVVYNSTYTEVAEGPTKGRTYQTVAVTEPNGSITYTGTLDNIKGKGKGKSKK
ncbi:hypothetical protein [Hymenobacter swuensis]|uniref:Uncharacterized protein n=1 Tax=Hymenobacter swuensis DY53 TaxID=1227739 RepID=W8F7Y4_9BACT|nr:hypothetical protein [Hymenobacter swuensis]AHJ97840.1 hypothetical protein Hsw_2245 [Hymenobacter swuensis DY53]